MEYEVGQKLVFIENLNDVLLTERMDDRNVMENDSIIYGMRGVITQIDIEWIGVAFSDRVHNLNGNFPRGRMGYTWWIKDYILDEAVRVVQKKNNYY